MSALAVLAALAVATGAVDPERATRDFKAANERALGGDLKGAIALYENLLGEGVKNEDLYYNLGNAYAEAGRLVDAAIAYERALRLAPSDDDAQANLAAVRAKLGVAPKPGADGVEPNPSPIDAIEPIVAPLSRDLFAALAILADCFFFGLLLVRRYANDDRKRRAASIGTPFALAALLLSGTVVLAQSAVARDPRAVAKESRDTKEGPHPRFRTKGALKAGARLRILKRDGDWLEVQSPDATTGWVPSSAVERV